MNITLFLFIDISGSMNEMGKAHLQRNLCRYITQLKIIDKKKYSDIDIQFLQWSAGIKELAVKEDGDIPEIKPQGVSSLKSITDYLTLQIKNDSKFRVLLLTDGFFDDENEISSFKKWQDNYKDQVITSSVAVGADANLFKLEKASEKVYLSEDIATAVNSICFDSFNIIKAPKSIEQIQLTKTTEVQDGWDE